MSCPDWNSDWFPLPGQAVFDREKQQIAAVSRAPGNLDLFVIGFDNHVWSTLWGPLYDSTIRLHLKILTNPNVAIDTMLESMREVYRTARIRVDVGSTENLNLPALNDLDVG